jgi:glycosyltransferase involved in cell wall biosynthesis
VGWFDAFTEQAAAINRRSGRAQKSVVMIDGSDRRLVCELLKCADLFVLLSNIEASPLVLFEAAASGVPFVASDVGNSGEIAAWTGGGVIVRSRQRPNGRVQAIHLDALWQVWRLARNPERRRRMGAAAREAWERRFTWETLAKDYLEVYAGGAGA